MSDHSAAIADLGELEDQEVPLDTKRTLTISGEKIRTYEDYFPVSEKDFPEGITEIILRNSELPNEILFEHTPDSVHTVFIVGCSNLPATLGRSCNENIGLNVGSERPYVYIENCNDFEYIPHLYHRITHLLISNCPNFVGFDPELTEIEKIRCQLEALHIQNCPKMESFSASDFSENLSSLFISDSPNLRELSGSLRRSMKNVSLINCDNLTSLPHYWPDYIETISLENCTSLKKIPTNTPWKGLLELNLAGCDSLEYTADLYNFLEELEKTGCDIILPEHIANAEPPITLEERLENIINNCHPRPENVQKIFDDFLHKNVDERGGSEHLEHSIIPILEILEEHPALLPLLEEPASGFLDACVNQPTAGFIHMNGWSAVYTASSLAEKLDAYKQVITSDALNEFISKSDEKPGIHLEAEAHNALFREVHKKLRENGDISQTWHGIPEYIAFENTISRWLTEERVDRAYQSCLNEVIELSYSALAKHACERNPVQWAAFAYPEEKERIQALYEKKSTALDVALDKNTTAEEKAESAREGGFLAEYQELSGLSEEELQEKQKDLGCDRDRAIASRVQALTLRDLSRHGAAGLYNPEKPSFTAKVMNGREAAQPGGMAV